MGLAEIIALKDKAKLPKEKKRYVIPRKSKKKMQQEQQEREQLNGSDTLMENWFKHRRNDLVGVCQCGCGQPSQKKDDMYFRHSCCHLFPKRDFESIMYHPLNYVERRFWGGCHTNLDEQGMDKWVNMADWDDMKAKFHVLAPLLTPEERAMKFFRLFSELVQNN